MATRSSGDSDGRRSPVPSAAAATTKKTAAPASRKPVDTLSNPNSSSNGDSPEQPTKKSDMPDSALSEESSTTPETESAAATSGNKKRTVSAREQRSQRRQAMIDEFGTALVSPPSHPQSGSGKRKNNGKTSKSKRPRHEEDGKCLKIKLLTGTLYLYRGPRNRRAEFVRRV